MKIGDKEYLNLSQTTRNEIEQIDITRAIVSDEFNKRGENTDYRQRAIKRLVKMNAPIYNEINIAWPLIELAVKLNCPYCHKNMFNTKRGGSNGTSTTSNFNCACGASATLTLSKHELYFTPKE